ncbi:Hypothetical protein NTJ_04638 [Nesidiocoris tenuis]|uniref:Uncharacterized protein n=1 Tax=Nesidiocoris tenuis TaxID=355587 RepID=A0ABN7AHU0_9HEMI|nr:Hypothetical protein NTJ_04638 [Nesidiocoris tenuis]
MVVDVEFEVRGVAVDAPAVVRPLSLADGCPHKAYYWLEPTAVAGHDPGYKWPVLTVRAAGKRKDEKLHELLTTPVDVKRRRTTAAIEKIPFELANHTLPSYAILRDIYRSQRKTLEDMKHSLFGPYRYDKSPDALFDVSILYPYMSNAYKKLYGQHVENLRQIVDNLNTSQQKRDRGERRKIRIQGIVESQDSME